MAEAVTSFENDFEKAKLAHENTEHQAYASYLRLITAVDKAAEHYKRSPNAETQKKFQDAKDDAIAVTHKTQKVVLASQLEYRAYKALIESRRGRRSTVGSPSAPSPEE